VPTDPSALAQQLPAHWFESLCQRTAAQPSVSLLTTATLPRGVFLGNRLPAKRARAQGVWHGDRARLSKRAN
jgi:hypothetical protein